MLSISFAKHFSICLFAFMIALLISPFMRSINTFAQRGSNFVRQVRVIENDKIGLQDPVGLAFIYDTEHLLILAGGSEQFASSALDVIMMNLDEDQVSQTRLSEAIPYPINSAFEHKSNRLLILKPSAKQLLAIKMGTDGHLDPATLKHFDAQNFQIEEPQGMTVDPTTGHLFILDHDGPSLIRVEPSSDQDFDEVFVTKIALNQMGLSKPRGLALDPTSEHLHLLDAGTLTLYELTQTGRPMSIRDLSKFELNNPRSLVFAPSGDRTDEPTRMSLYIVDGPLDGEKETSTDISSSQQPNSTPGSQFISQIFLPLVRGSRQEIRNAATETESDMVGSPAKILELSFVQPAPARVSGIQAPLVQVIDTSQFSPPSPDPSGIAYLVTSDSLLVGDSEVSEMTIFTGINLFEMTVDGRLLSVSDTTSFSEEPTGLSFNPLNRHLFISDDDNDEIYEVDPGNDGIYGTADDIVTSFNTRAFNSRDPEGVAFAASPASIFIADGVNSEVYQVTPGANGRFDGVPPVGDDQVTSFDTEGLGLVDPEGIVFDANSGHLYVVGEPTDMLAQITTQGALVQMIDISESDADKPAGLAVAPGSLDATTMSFYITDRGVDNDSDPNENDGKVYELSIPQAVNLPPNVNAGTDQKLTLSAAANLNGTVSDDGQPDPPGAVNTTWSQVSGPGTIIFANVNAVDTTATFSIEGTYELRLSASDGEFTVNDEVVIMVNSSSSTTILEADFDTDADGFIYLDDVFRNTSEPNYADGIRINSGGFNGGALQITLGNVDNDDILGMSGGWLRNFSLNEQSETILSFRYNLTQASNYEGNELSQMLVSVDGVLYGIPPNDYVAQISGNGNGGSVRTTGWQLFQVNLGTLSTGNHTLAIGGYNNQKTLNDESTDILIDDVSLVSGNGNGTNIVEVRVSANSDDAEERASGTMSLNSTDLELTFDSGGNQTVGLRFNGVNIPQGSTITNAYIQFQVDETSTVATSLTLEGEATNSASTFISASSNISSRPRTGAQVIWTPPLWTAVGAAGPDQRTPNIASLIQEIVDRSGWSSGNALAVIVTGTGERVAESFNGSQTGAPLLHVEYSTNN